MELDKAHQEINEFRKKNKNHKHCIKKYKKCFLIKFFEKR